MTWGQTSDGVAHLPQEVIDAAAYKWQYHCSRKGGWSSSDCFIGFWSYYEPFIKVATSASQMRNFREHNLYSPDMYGGTVYARGATDMLTHAPTIPSNTYPQGWATIHAWQGEAFQYATSHSFAYDKLYSSGLSIFIVLTVNQQNSFCKAMGMPSMCNLTKAP